MSCWALWQRLPPRYQLSTREPEAAIDAVSTTHNRSPRAPLSAGTSPRFARDSINKHIISSRLANGESHFDREVLFKQNYSVSQEGKESTEEIKSYPSRGKGRATMFFTVQTSPRENAPAPATHCQTAFPLRNSPFLTSFKQQQRINSARQSFVDPSTTPTSSPRRTESRHGKALATRTQFPITRMDTNSGINNASTSRISHKYNKNTKSARNSVEESSFKQEPNPKSVIDLSSRLSVNTLLPVQEVKPFVKNPLYSETHNVRYVLKTTQNSSLFIDNDRVLVIKPNRSHAQSAPPSRENSASYLAHLRRLYLKDPKDFAKTNNSHASGSTKRKILYERLEYEKRTDSILNYYSRADDVEIATAWASAIALSRRPKTTPSSRASKRREGAKTSRSQRSPSRPTSARTRPNSARFPFELADPVPCAQSPRDALGDWDEFLKINSRSALHERQFYLRTPALGRHGLTHMVAEGPQQQNDCACKVCQLESERIIQEGYELAILPNTHENSVSGSQEYHFSNGLDNGQGHVLSPKEPILPGLYKIADTEGLETSDIARNETNITQFGKSQCVTNAREMRTKSSSTLTNKGDSDKILTNDKRNKEKQTLLATSTNTIASEKRFINEEEVKINSFGENLKPHQAEMYSKDQNKFSEQNITGTNFQESNKRDDPRAKTAEDLETKMHDPSKRTAIKHTNLVKTSICMEIHLPFQEPNNSIEVDADINESSHMTSERGINLVKLYGDSGRLTQTASSPADPGKNQLDNLGQFCKTNTHNECSKEISGHKLAVCEQDEKRPWKELPSTNSGSTPVKEVVVDVKTGSLYVKLEANDMKCSDNSGTKKEPKLSTL